eukprot:TRINITY_DN17148_c0_g1_i1.p1 TRINITY_DN17148_c0_g1~~TRINITY_DN17148_c0_g1_i1.p1  ORF type:complete len:606 (+),score=90.61 TRINITY_DN17148_c0_g1_i1:229-2046(+)
MKEKESKIAFLKEKKQRLVPLALMVMSLCALSFYLGGVFSSDRTGIRSDDESVKAGGAGCTAVVKLDPLPACPLEQQDMTPCTDPVRWRKFPKARMAFRERHCPPISERQMCLIPPPEGYKTPITWPRSKDECWYRNVPYEWINSQKANQNWLRKKNDKFVFPGGGTMFPDGVTEYVNRMEELIPEMKDGSIRTALDTGCGVASWGGDLLERKILTVSLAPRDNHEAQVQFALERGIPAILGVLSTERMPFPANAFDMAHCSRCLIPWTEFGGQLLLEVDRVLRPGGFWVLSGPPVNYEVHWKGWESTEEKQRRDMDNLQDLLKRMCYKRYNNKEDIMVWQKPSDNSCYEQRDSEETITEPAICDDHIEADAAWYTPMRACIVPQEKRAKKISVGAQPAWPARLHTPPERLSFVGGSKANFKADSQKWADRLAYYKTLVPDLGTSKIRNVMDMNTEYGGLAAALIDDPVWVMNVVSSYATNTLGVIYDRGLIGTINDWCEPFSTYPRTYDLLHASGLFSSESHRCDLKWVMLEMDRILRPKGYAIIQDTPQVLDNAKVIGKAMRWKCTRRPSNKEGDAEAILVCKKSFWTGVSADTQSTEATTES